MTGPAVVYGTDGDKFEFTYVEGKIQGMVIFGFEMQLNSNNISIYIYIYIYICIYII